MNYVDLESILVPEENGKPNPDESCTDKYQKPIAYSYPFKQYVLTLNLVNLLSLTQMKMLFTILLIV